MHVNMILADSDPIYTAVLAARLQTRLPHVKISRCNDPAALRAAIACQKMAGGPALFLYNAADFHELKHLSTADLWPPSWQARPLLADRHWQGSQDVNLPVDLQSGFCRYDPVSSLIEQLQEQFDFAPETPERITTGSDSSGPSSSGSDSAGPYAPGTPVVDPSEEAARRPTAVPEPCVVLSENDIPVEHSGLRLILSVASSGYDKKQTRQCLADLVSHGYQVFYLPLMPTYQMTCLAEPGQGPNLSDLLLHLVGQDPGCDQLGRYCQQHPDGYFQFRPPDRTDDLVLCQPETLRLLIGKLRDYVLRQPPVTIAVIDCAGLPLGTVAVVAVLCDACHVSIAGGSGFAAEAARMEAGRLFAVLPTSCKIWRSWLT